MPRTTGKTPAYADDFIGPREPMMSVNLPFDGFYETKFSDLLDCNIEQDAEHHEEQDESEQPTELRIDASDYSEILFDAADFSAGYAEIAKDYAEAFSNYLSDKLEFDCGIRFEEMTSPREYNFTTDMIYAHIPTRVVRKLYDLVSKKDLCAKIKERHTSRDGFISFYSNNCDEWNDKPIADWDYHELGTLIRTIVEKIDKDWSWSIYYDMCDYGFEYWSNCVDWKKFEAAVAEKRAELAADHAALVDAGEAEPIAYRCPDTPDLFKHN